MKTPLLTTLVSSLLAGPVLADGFTVIVPDDLQRARFEINDPDKSVYTLGKPEIVFDFAAGQDSLLDLKIRRSNLRFADGSPFTAFAAHKDQKIVVIARGDVAHVSISGVSENGNARDALVLFSGKDGTLLSPAAEDVAVFDTDLKPLAFSYTPLAVPDQAATLPVNLLLDISGSMTGFTDDVISATRDFLSVLPNFARCRLYAFNETLQELTPGGVFHACTLASSSLANLPEPSGATNLFRALGRVISRTPPEPPSELRPVTLVITDGVDTSGKMLSQSLSTAAKLVTNGHVFVFWAGNADPRALQSIADLQVTATTNGKEDLSVELERFYTDLGLSLSGIQILRITGR